MNADVITPGADERIDTVNEQIRLIQKKNGLTFGTDAYMLAAFVRPFASARAADLGSGTGIISLLCAARGKLAHISAVELQREFAELGKRNIKLNGFEDKITQLCADVRELSAAMLGGELDVVISNPPYMKSGNGKSCDHDIKNIARHEENGSIYDFCAAAARLLKFGGKFYVVWRPDRLADLIDALRQNKLEPKRMTFILPDAQSAPSAVLTEARLGGSPSLDVTPSLILYRDSAKGQPRVFTAQAEQVYNSCTL